MIDYSKGKIYRINAIDNMKYPSYIGCTTKEYLSMRLSQHKTQYHDWLDGKAEFCPVFQLFVLFGEDRCKITLLEDYACDSKNALNSRLWWWVNIVDYKVLNTEY